MYKKIKGLIFFLKNATLLQIPKTVGHKLIGQIRRKFFLE